MPRARGLMLTVLDSHRLEPGEEPKKLGCRAEVVRMHLVALALEDPGVPGYLAPRGLRKLDRNTAGRQHGPEEGTAVPEDPGDLADRGAHDLLVSMVDHVPAQDMIEVIVGERQGGHPALDRLDVQPLGRGGGAEGRVPLGRRVERGHREASSRQRQRMAPDARAEIEHPRARGERAGPADHVGFRLRPFAVGRDRGPFGVPVRVRGVGFHLSVPMMRRRSRPPSCSTRTTTTAIIRITVIAVG